MRFASLGAEILSGNGNKPLDVMEHLGKFSSHSVVLWRAACWGQSGVESVLSGGERAKRVSLVEDEHTSHY